jgi:hypothetical protein
MLMTLIHHFFYVLDKQRRGESPILAAGCNQFITRMYKSRLSLAAVPRRLWVNRRIRLLIGAFERVPVTFPQNVVSRHYACKKSAQRQRSRKMYRAYHA